MTDFRISWRNGDLRGAEWVSGENAAEAAERFRSRRGVMDGFFITSVSKRCGATTKRGVFGIFGGACKRLTTGERCSLHRES